MQADVVQRAVSHRGIGAEDGLDQSQGRVVRHRGSSAAPGHPWLAGRAASSSTSRARISSRSQTRQSKRQLGHEYAVLQADVEPCAIHIQGQATFALSQDRQGGGKEHGFLIACRHRLGENLHHGRREHVHPKQAEIMSGTKAGHDPGAVRPQCGGRLLDHGFDLVQARPTGNAMPTHYAVVGEHALACGLDTGDRGLLSLSRLHQLLGTASWLVAEVEVIAHQMDEGLIVDERCCPEECFAVSLAVGVERRTPATGNSRRPRRHTPADRRAAPPAQFARPRQPPPLR